MILVYYDKITGVYGRWEKNKNEDSEKKLEEGEGKREKMHKNPI